MVRRQGMLRSRGQRTSGMLAVRGLDWGLVLDTFTGVSLKMIALAIIVFFAANYLRAARWRVLFVGDEVSTNRLFIIQNIGLA